MNCNRNKYCGFIIETNPDSCGQFRWNQDFALYIRRVTDVFLFCLYGLQELYFYDAECLVLLGILFCFYQIELSGL